MKFVHADYLPDLFQSPLAEGRELKFFGTERRNHRRASPLAEGRELKLFAKPLINGGESRPSRRGVN